MRMMRFRLVDRILRKILLAKLPRSDINETLLARSVNKFTSLASTNNIDIPAIYDIQHDHPPTNGCTYENTTEDDAKGIKRR